MELRVLPSCAGSLRRGQCPGQHLQSCLDVARQSERLCQQAENHWLVEARPRRSSCCQAVADPFHRGYARQTLRHRPTLTDQAMSEKECEPMLSCKGGQLVRKLFRLGGLSRGDRRQATIAKAIGESFKVNGLMCLSKRFIASFDRLVGAASVPECPRPDRESPDAEISAKPDDQLLMFLGFVQCYRGFQVRQRRGVISDDDQRHADELIADQQQFGPSPRLGE